MSDFARTAERVELELDEGLFTDGIQLVVDVGGERVVDLAIGEDGLGRPLTTDHVLRVYCTIKPMLAVAVARLVEEGQLALDEPLGAALPEVRGVQDGVTLRHLMTHTAGLHIIGGVAMEFIEAEKRRAILETAVKPVTWAVGRDAGYSEYAAWMIIGWLVEKVTATPLRIYLRETLLDPLGLGDSYIGMTPEQYARLSPRLGVNHDRRDLASWPMLFERLERVCTETNPAHGGYTNARDMATFYSALLERLAGSGNDALPSPKTLHEFTTSARPLMFDEVLDRECPYGLGFMTELAYHEFGDRCSASSFGHSGNIGSSFAFADPDRDLAVAVVFNGLVSHEAAFLRRRALLRAVYNDLDDIDTASAAIDLGAVDEPARAGRFRWRRKASRS